MDVITLPTTKIESGKTLKIVMTGGHHSSALPIIEELKRRKNTENLNYEIFWIGHKHSLIGDKNPTLEYKEITDLGIKFFELHAGKVYKTFNLKRLIKVPLGFFQAFYLLLKIKPDVILSFGGYLAVPVVLAGWFLGIPSLTHEQTIVSGYANNFIAHFVNKILISWPESRKYFDEKKVIETGIPLRDAIFTSNSNAFSIETLLPTIYITAGKTGSHTINKIVAECMPELLDICNVIHQTGDYSELNDFDYLQDKYVTYLHSITKTESNKIVGKYFIRKYVLTNEIGEAFAKSDIIVGRSGAHTIAEVLALKKPALFIPIPWVSHNEQYENATLVVGYGLGNILEEKNLTKKTFLSAIKNMLADLSVYYPKKDIEKLFNKHSAKIIADEILSISDKK